MTSPLPDHGRHLSELERLQLDEIENALLRELPKPITPRQPKPHRFQRLLQEHMPNSIGSLAAAILGIVVLIYAVVIAIAMGLKGIT